MNAHKKVSHQNETTTPRAFSRMQRFFSTHEVVPIKLILTVGQKPFYPLPYS
jgi:hypothetical protein